MPNKKDFTVYYNQKFSRLTLVVDSITYKSNPKNNNHNVPHGKFICDCGNLIEVPLSKVITSTNTKSCGCLNRDRLIERNTTHGKSHTPLYKTYKKMKDRCYNPNHKDYKDYGGRGIRVSDHWLSSFDNFYSDMYVSFKKGLSIDRIDPDGNYETSNCRWATPRQQGCNKRKTKRLEYLGKKLSLTEWCEELNLNYNKTKARINRLNWSVQRAFETP